MVDPRNPNSSGDGEDEENRRSINESSSCSFGNLPDLEPGVVADIEGKQMMNNQPQQSQSQPANISSPESSGQNHSVNYGTEAERQTEPPGPPAHASSEDSDSRGENIPEIRTAETEEEKIKRKKAEKAMADRNYRQKIKRKAEQADKLVPENEELRKEIASQKAMVDDLTKRLAEKEKSVDDLTKRLAEEGRRVDELTKMLAEEEKKTDDLTNKLAKKEKKRKKQHAAREKERTEYREIIQQLESDVRKKDAKIEDLNNRYIRLLEIDTLQKDTSVNAVQSKVSILQRGPSFGRQGGSSEFDSITQDAGN